MPNNEVKGNKPHVMCEYGHAMGNGPGGLKAYQDMYRKYKRLQVDFSGNGMIMESIRKKREKSITNTVEIMVISLRTETFVLMES